MTSFDDFATSLEDSRPLEIFALTLGSTTYRYTSAEDSVTVASQTYTPIGISRNNIVQGSDAQNRTLSITVPSDNEFASQYRNIVPGQRASISIWQLERDESPAFDTQILMFKGQVLSVSYPNDGYQADINCQSIESALNRTIPRFTYMSSCNNVLYDSACGVASAGFSVVGTVSSVSGNVITLPGANSQPDGYYTGGYCTPVSGQQDFRMIVNHVGNDLTLLLPFATDVDGASVQAFAGCDHLIGGDCSSKFNNVGRFAGFAFVPNDNIFQDGLD